MIHCKCKPGATVSWLSAATKESICSAYERVKQRAHEKNKNIQPSWASLMRVVATQSFGREPSRHTRSGQWNPCSTYSLGQLAARLKT